MVKNNTVLIIGGGGVVSFAIISKLLELKYNVYAVSRRENRLTRTLFPTVSFIDLDEVFFSLLPEILARINPTVVLYTASINDNCIPVAGPRALIDVNLNFLQETLEALRLGCNTVLIHFSSCEVDSVLRRFKSKSVTPYVYSKLASELLVKMYRDSYEVNGYVIRLPTVFGPGDLSHNRLVAGHILSRIRHEPFVLRNPCKERRPWLFANDIVPYVLSIISGLSSQDYLFRVTSTEKYSNQEVYGLLSEAIDLIFSGVPDPPSIYEGINRTNCCPEEPVHSKLSGSKMRNNILHTVKWYYENAELINSLKLPRSI